MKIFVCFSLGEAQLSRLRAAAGGADVMYFPDPLGVAAARPAFDDSDIVFGNPPAAWIGLAARTRWIQLESVGFGEYAGLNWGAMMEPPVVTNLAGFFSEAVAESIIAGILAHYRGVTRLRSLQDQGRWVGDPLRTSLATLEGARIVLLGRGGINRRVLELLEPFHCHVTVFGRDLDPAKLDESLANADVVVCAVPHTGETSDFFDRRRIERLKRGALLMNFGRGSLLDENALADALVSGHLGAAVIDVTRDEPLPTAHRFWSIPNLLLTQHTAGGTGDEIDRKIDHFLDNLGRYHRREPLLNPVNFNRGY
jgi:glyoxylate/hydroxypyruvate reductase A